MMKEYCVFANKLPVSSNIEFFKKDGEIFKFTNLHYALKSNFKELIEFLGDDTLVVCRVKELNELQRDVELKVALTKEELNRLYARDFVTLKD